MNQTTYTGCLLIYYLKDRINLLQQDVWMLMNGYKDWKRLQLLRYEVYSKKDCHLKVE